MKTKTINKVINAKFDEWIGTITDKQVVSLIEKNSICTGGCIASMLLQEEPNDFDFYFRNVQTALAVARYYVSQHPTPDVFEVTEEPDRVLITMHGVLDDDTSEDDAVKKVKEEDSGKYEVKFISNNAISLSDKLQMVVRFIGEPEKIHENYDFVHATNYWTSWERKVTLRTDALECLLARELRYIGSKYPICSVMRMRKFIQRGFSINAGQVLKICLQISELDLSDVNVLKEQIMGVDVAYFWQILSALQEKKMERVDKSYLVEIIDRIFG